MKSERRTISTHWSATFSPCRDMSIRFAGNTLFLSYWTKCCAPSLGETNRCRIFGHVQYTSIAILSPRLWEKHRLNGGSEPPPHVQTALANCECHSKRSLQTGGACEQEMKALESGKLNGTCQAERAQQWQCWWHGCCPAEGSETCQVKLWHPRTAETNNTIPVWFPCMFLNRGVHGQLLGRLFFKSFVRRMKSFSSKQRVHTEEFLR